MKTGIRTKWASRCIARRVIFPLIIAACVISASGATLKVPLKTGWKFVKADDPAVGTNLTQQAMSALLDLADRGDTSGAPLFSWAESSFDDSSWGEVRVPHDWGVDVPFDSDRSYGDAFLDVTGIGWYRLKFPVPDRGGERDAHG